MRGFETLLVALALGCDAFAVGMGVGTRFCNRRQIFRLAFHFGLFQALMPMTGWALGQNAVGFARDFAPWIAFGLLFAIGGKMTYESLHPCEEEEQKDFCIDPTRGWSLVMLSLATSMDALGVGFSLGILGRDLFLSALCIGIVAGLMTWTAMRLGNCLSEKWGRRMETAGGVVLMAIAVKLLVM